MPKIVVVEDQQVMATVYRNKFLAEGYQVEVAIDGEAGINLINSARPDLVILDVMMPKLNGIEVLKKIRANPLFQSLPVIIFSNASLPGMVEEAWKEGATMVLSKSSHSPKQIVETVRKALKGSGESQPSDGPVTAKTLAPPADVLALTQPAKPEHVLLVEDHPDVCSLISFLLDQAGHQVTSVESHAGALRQTKLQEFDLFLINRVCPDGLGLALCRQLRQAFPRHQIIIYSSAALPAEQKAGLDAGASAYLSKSSDLLNIGNFLSEAIKGSRSLPVIAQGPIAVPPLAA